MDTNSTSGNGSDRISKVSQDQAGQNGIGATTGTTNTTNARSGIVSTVNLKGSSNSAQQSAASLRTELSSLKSDLDALVNRSASLSDEELIQAHAKLMAKFGTMRYAARGIATEAGRQINRGVETTTTYVKDKPVQSVAVAVGTGLLLGLLFKRR